MDPRNMPKGFTAHRGRHENRLSRPVRPPHEAGKLDAFNLQRLKEGKEPLHPTKGYRTPRRKQKPGYKPPERKSVANKAKELFYAFLGYGP